MPKTFWQWLFVIVFLVNFSFFLLNYSQKDIAGLVFNGILCVLSLLVLGQERE